MPHHTADLLTCLPSVLPLEQVAVLMRHDWGRRLASTPSSSGGGGWIRRLNQVPLRTPLQCRIQGKGCAACEEFAWCCSLLWVWGQPLGRAGSPKLSCQGAALVQS